jgi:hypothetical protein
MTLTTILIVNILLDAALIGGVAYLMSHTAKLTPHRPGVTGNAWKLRRRLRHSTHSARPERAPARLSPALD